MERLAIFIDGEYFTKLKDHLLGERKKIDYGKLAQKILEHVDEATKLPVELLKVHYYDCLPYQDNPPTTEQRKKVSNKDKFLDALRRKPRFTGRLGKLRKRIGKKKNAPRFEQKGVDLLLGLDLVLLSLKQRITHAAIITGDSDLVPAVEIASREGIIVWLLYSPKSAAHDLLSAADERIELSQSFLTNVNES